MLSDPLQNRQPNHIRRQNERIMLLEGQRGCPDQRMKINVRRMKDGPRIAADHAM